MSHSQCVPSENMAFTKDAVTENAGCTKADLQHQY
uniref:Uncharacterized protein n=1 Tax=Anguilla anguilla TaxID=7936 RepID=A0A0E9S6Y3_ANGAN